MEIGGGELCELERRASAAGAEVVGVYHSHPFGTARPSRLDLARAWPSWSYVIVGMVGRLALRSWRLDEGLGAFVEERLDTERNQAWAECT